MKKTKIKYCKSEGLSLATGHSLLLEDVLCVDKISTQWLQSIMPPDIVKYPLKGSLTQLRTIAVSKNQKIKFKVNI